MRHLRIRGWLVLLGMLLILGSLGLMSSVLSDWERVSGARQLDKLIVNANAAESKAKGLELQEAEQFSKKWPLGIAYSAAGQEKAAAGSVSVLCDVFGVSGDYSQFTSFPMRSGSTISQKAVDEHSRVAVLSERTADKLFRSRSVVGKQIKLFDTNFTITGVYADRESLLKQLSDDGIADIWIPVTAMLDVRPESRIQHMQLAVHSEGAVRAETDAVNGLRALGMNPANFRIDNEVLRYRQLAQLPKLLLFGCGTAAIYMLVRLIIRLWGEQITSFRRRRLIEEFSNIVKHKRYTLLFCIIATLAAAACTALIWQQIRFRFYIAPEWLPEELIQVSFYVDKLRSVWEQQAVQAGYVPSPQERLSDVVDLLSWRLLLIGACGIPILWTGLKWWAIRRVPVSIQLQSLFLMIPVIALVVFATVKLTGLNMRLDLTEYAVVGVFMISCVLFIHKFKGVNSLDIQDKS
ncbi:ABC transporter permease [Paenibacillus planticolens]|uniref:ABC transporter permease n=1 Tax=Paenibacillus planticolens TaxID=2654976 RepID=UPI0014926B5F|nr:ABC transporter permease [Paenibacillus planticolens]